MNSSSSNNIPCLCSVIIVSYNNHDDILSCLNALQQSAPASHLQVIVIDNHSADDTQAIIRTFQKSTGHFADFIAIFNTVNMGFTKAQNQGIDAATAPFILFLNPDTKVPEDAVDRLIQLLESNPSIGVVAPQLLNADGSIQPSCRRFPRHRDVFFSVTGSSSLWPRNRLLNGWKMGDFDHRQAFFVEQPQGACLLTTRAVLQKVGKWDERFPMFFSDVDWCRSVRNAGYKILFTPEVKIIHYQGKSIIPNRPAMILSSHRSFIRYFFKYYPGPKWLVPNFFVTLLLAISGGLRFCWAGVFKLLRFY